MHGRRVENGIKKIEVNSVTFCKFSTELDHGIVVKTIIKLPTWVEMKPLYKTRTTLEF